jgi:hypothetical protein
MTASKIMDALQAGAEEATIWSRPGGFQPLQYMGFGREEKRKPVIRQRRDSKDDR